VYQCTIIGRVSISVPDDQEICWDARTKTGKRMKVQDAEKCQLRILGTFLAERTNGHAYATVLWRYVLWLNGAS